MGILPRAVFQSTRPMRGATRIQTKPNTSSRNFNPRAPCGARRGIDLKSRLEWNFNPRAPCGARRFHHCSSLMMRFSFQSTRPMRGATPASPARSGGYGNFNPRAPCGARPNSISIELCDAKFQSTRPMRGATVIVWPYLNQFVTFQSTRPMRGATLFMRISSCPSGFQSTRPMRGATAKVNKLLCTFLQKRHGFQIFLRKTLPFKAFCRLQIGKNFSICGANRCGNFCELLLRTIRSSVLPEGRSACSQNAQFYSHTFSRDNRNADCLFPDP